MKKLFLFVTLITLVISQGFSQASVYHPIPLTNAEWRTDHFDQGICVANIYSLCTSLVFYPEGDTIINSKAYTKFYEDGISYEYGSSDMHVYYGAMRQDTTSKKVYFFALNQLSEYVLYNFNLEVGDTSEEGILTLGGIVESIDSVLVGTEYHKRFNFFNSYPYYIYLIEGVGTNGGLFSGIYDGYGFEVKDILKCFKLNGTTVLEDTLYEWIPCDLFTSNTPLVDQSPQITLYPNPVSVNTTLTLKSNSPERCFITIFDLTGMPFYHSSFLEELNLFLSRNEFTA
ncbi:MAG: hypothetical protein ABIQ74_00615, partial [Chitinophagales bacterium]